jgi:hypothetical protein
MEYQKKVTDSVRKLTRMKRLQLWEERPSVFMLAELEDAINRLVYLFLNPANAGLVTTIDEYPGLSTWHAFKTCEPSVDAEVVVPAYWTPVSALETLPVGNRLSPANDREMAKRLTETERTMEYTLVIKPLAWLRTYGVTEPGKIEAIRRRIIEAVYAEEAALSKERIEKGRPVLGAERLKQQPYFRPHTPKRKERRIFVICGNHELRPQIIASHKEISRKHRTCYQLLKDGLPHEWPPGTFIPWLPPTMSLPSYHMNAC